MTKEELKRRQYDTWNRYYQKHKSEINARRKKVREDYKNKLSVTENQLTKAKEIIKRIIKATYGEGWNYSLQVKVEAEKFLKEIK